MSLPTINWSKSTKLHVHARQHEHLPMLRLPHFASQRRTRSGRGRARTARAAVLGERSRQLASHFPQQSKRATDCTAPRWNAPVRCVQFLCRNHMCTRTCGRVVCVWERERKSERQRNIRRRERERERERKGEKRDTRDVCAQKRVDELTALTP
jgi:hypothetical protein